MRLFCKVGGPGGTNTQKGSSPHSARAPFLLMVHLLFRPRYLGNVGGLRARARLKDNSGRVFEKRGALMIDLKDPEKTRLERPRFHRVMTRTWDAITSDRYARAHP